MTKTTNSQRNALRNLQAVIATYAVVTQITLRAAGNSIIASIRYSADVNGSLIALDSKIVTIGSRGKVVAL